MAAVRVSAKADYAVRAAVELAAAGEGEVVKGEQLAEAQAIPIKFLENILVDLRQAGIVNRQSGDARCASPGGDLWKDPPRRWPRSSTRPRRPPSWSSRR